MTGYVTTAQGVTTVLPTPVSWCFQYTSGVPCDSFRLRCIWDGDNQVKPEEWAMFQALKDGEVRFTGVVDECEILLGPEGAFFEVSGRGMAARLLDNEALSQDYELATPADILRDHVEPYGIRTEGGAALGPVSRFSVAAGSSEWAVLYEFARYHNGICPRFDREGRLILSPWADTREIALDDAVPVERLSCRVRRYGVLSQVVVRDRYQNRTETVDNPAFQSLGGRRRQVVTMPGKSQYQAMRYSGPIPAGALRRRAAADPGGDPHAVFRSAGGSDASGAVQLGAQRALSGDGGPGGPGRERGMDQTGTGAP